MGPPGMENGVPLAYEPVGTWAPPGIALPWPKDEYLRDGGDFGLQTVVRNGDEVLGLDMEDAVAYYGTPDGKTVVEPTNPVYIYSPRFGAVRQVVGLSTNEQSTAATNVTTPVQAAHHEDSLLVLDNSQKIQSNAEIGNRSLTIMHSKQGDGAMSGSAGLKAVQNNIQTYDRLKIFRLGQYDAAEMYLLTQGVEAAHTWNNTQSIEVIINNTPAVAARNFESLESVFQVDLPPGMHKLRVIKVASTPFAKPGEVVDFIIRFDNLGNETLQNVTIVDSLSTRLEYVPDSAECSREAVFSTQLNEGDSVSLRCLLSNPLEPLRGGALRFRCIVR
jgi:uncharacterized repeat protein (TIGR01451 family)